jgi:UDPglucose 6-dehydrogenase
MRPYQILKRELKSLKGKRIAVWGLSFKPRTDDVREAPALYVIEALLKAGAKVVAYDPVAGEAFDRTLQDKRVHYTNDAYAMLEGVDALVVMTEWDEFRTADLGLMHRAMKGNLIVDGRNIFERSEAEESGFKYFGIGV